MKKYSLVFIIFCQIVILQAQVDTSLMIDAVEITNNRIGFNQRELGRSVKIISKQEIASLPVQSVAEALQMVAGFDVRRRGPNNVQSDISVRGGSFDQVLILINGVRMNDAQTGHHTLYIPVDLLDIERIEIVKGPAAKLYGQNAFSGAVNIVTKVGDKDGLNVGISQGSFNTTSLRAGVTKVLNEGNWKQNLQFFRESSDGYDYNRDYKVFNLYYDSNLKVGSNGELKIFGGYTDRKFGANGFYALPTFKDQYEEVETSIASIKYTNISGNWRVTPGFSWRRNYDNYLFVRNNPPVFRNRTLGNRLTADVNVSNYNALGVLGIGLEYSRESLRSIRLGEDDRNLFGFFIEQKISLLNDQLTIVPGFYINKFSARKATFLPGLDVAYFPVKNLKIFASANYASRIPTYTDLFYVSAAEIGNPNLESESVKGYEVGTQYARKGFSAGVTAYMNFTNGLIDWTKVNASDAQWVANNYAATKISGLEVNSALDFKQLLNLKQTLVLDLSASFIDAKSNEKEQTYVTRYQFNHLGTQLISNLRIGFFEDKLLASIAYRNIDRVSSDVDPVTKKELLDAQLLDASLGFSYKGWGAKLMANNLTNAQYKEITNVVMPGRWYQFSVSKRL
ncbi:MAG TPA: TonB-dependent receptor [Saprospiraceae bacterium]|nr:TonB-dependent receptor [Saprospiraceae bacterium]